MKIISYTVYEQIYQFYCSLLYTDVIRIVLDSYCSILVIRVSITFTVFTFFRSVLLSDVTIC